MTNLPLKIIDPHLHLFHLQQGDYNWLKSKNPPFWPDKELIHKNFDQADLELGPKFKLAGYVHIEAGFDNRQPWREIDWLEQQHKNQAENIPFRSVAFADITQASFAQDLECLAQRRSVVGIRYILDEQAQSILNSELTARHLDILSKAKLSFDAQLSLLDNQAIQALIRLANQHADLVIIINHGGWPPNQDDVANLNIWRLNLQKLAECKNIGIKLSGWEMTNRAWQTSQVRAAVETCVGFFGMNRVMLASNFPLCLFSKSYAKIWHTYLVKLGLSQESLENLAYLNAKTWYKLTGE